MNGHGKMRDTAFKYLFAKHPGERWCAEIICRCRFIARAYGPSSNSAARTAQYVFDEHLAEHGALEGRLL